MLRLTITRSLCTIIIIIKQVSLSSKIIIISKKIIIKVYPKFLNIYNFILNDDPVLSTAIRFHFFSEVVGCSVNTWNSQNLKKLLWSLSADRIYFMTCNRVSRVLELFNSFLKFNSFI